MTTKQYSKQQFKKILCVRTDNMGDVLMTTPAFRAIKQTYPQNHLTLLTSSNAGAITPYIPYIDKTIIFDAPWTKHTKNPSNIFTAMTTLKREQFDLACIFTNFSQNPIAEALLCYMADIPERIAFCRENPYGLLTQWLPDIEPVPQILHGVERQLRLVEHIGAITRNTKLSLIIDPKDITTIFKLFQKLGICSSKPLILIHPGASEEKRRYPIEFFAEVAKKLTQSFQVGITGTTNEQTLLNYIHNYCDQKTFLFHHLSTGKLIALISKAGILISNNTGPVHIAAAVQTPVVVLYALTNPEHTPWQVPHKVFYFPVKKELQTNNQILREISYPTPSNFSVDMIITAIKEIMKPASNYETTTHSHSYSLL